MTAPELDLCEITQADVRHDAPRPYLAVIVQDGEGTEYRRNFEPDANDDRIMEDFAKDWRNWRVI
jgi:hypothetical protein